MPGPESSQRTPQQRAETRQAALRAPIGAGSRRSEMRNALIASRLTPNAISITGLLGNLIAAYLVYQGELFWGGIAFIAGSVMDTLDGRYSRMSGKGTPFGAFLDSTLDRMEEGIVLIAVGAHFTDQGDKLAVAATVAAVLFSLMVSYTRARAEALGVECKVGIASRAVRVVILSIGLLFAHGPGSVALLEPAIYVLAAMTIITTFQRIAHVRGALLQPLPPDHDGSPHPGRADAL